MTRNPCYQYNSPASTDGSSYSYSYVAVTAPFENESTQQQLKAALVNKQQPLKAALGSKQQPLKALGLGTITDNVYYNSPDHALYSSPSKADNDTARYISTGGIYYNDTQEENEYIECDKI